MPIRFIASALLFWSLSLLHLSVAGKDKVTKFESKAQYRTQLIKLKFTFYEKGGKFSTPLVIEEGLFLCCPVRAPLEVVNGRNYVLALRANYIIRERLAPMIKIDLTKIFLCKVQWIARKRRIINEWEYFDTSRDVTYSFRGWTYPNDLKEIMDANPNVDYKNGFPIFVADKKLIY